MSVFFAANLPSIEYALFEVFTVMQAAGQVGAVVLVQEAHLDSMDRALWQKPQLAFVPHGQLDDPEAPRMPFILTHSRALQALSPDDPQLSFQPRSVADADPQGLTPAPSVRPLLVNIGGDPLPVFARFKGLLELIPSSDHPHHAGFNSIQETINHGRERYRHYRDQGCALAHGTNDEPFIKTFAQWWANVAAA